MAIKFEDLIRNTIFACTMFKMDLIGFRKRIEGGSND